MYLSGAQKGPASAAASGRVKLLLVDDDRDNLLALQAVLEPLQQELMLAESGTDALRLCLDHDFAAAAWPPQGPARMGLATCRLGKRRNHCLPPQYTLLWIVLAALAVVLGLAVCVVGGDRVWSGLT